MRPGTQDSASPRTLDEHSDPSLRWMHLSEGTFYHATACIDVIVCHIYQKYSEMRRRADLDKSPPIRFYTVCHSAFSCRCINNITSR